MAGQSKFKEEIGEMICERLEEGQSLLSICRELNLKHSTVCKWTRLFPETFGVNFARAREEGDDIEFERLAELAMEEPPTVKGFTDNGWVNWKRNQIDLAKWMLARKRPKKYSEKVEIEHSGSLGVQLVNDIPRPKRDPQ